MTRIKSNRLAGVLADILHLQSNTLASRVANTSTNLAFSPASSANVAQVLIPYVEAAMSIVSIASADTTSGVVFETSIVAMISDILISGSSDVHRRQRFWSARTRLSIIEDSSPYPKSASLMLAVDGSGSPRTNEENCCLTAVRLIVWSIPQIKFDFLSCSKVELILTASKDILPIRAGCFRSMPLLLKY